MGYKDFDHQKLFEVFYDDEEFSKKVYAEIEKDAGEEFKKLTEKKNELFKELDSLLVETYQTSTVLIDDARLVAGEEGCLCTLDIEFIKSLSTSLAPKSYEEQALTHFTKFEEEQKQEFAKAVTESAVEILKTKKEHVIIVFDENPKENWFLAGDQL